MAFQLGQINMCFCPSPIHIDSFSYANSLDAMVFLPDHLPRKLKNESTGTIKAIHNGCRRYR